jgi:hypothetical protein
MTHRATFVLLALAFATASAFHCTGHMLVAKIALDSLPPRMAAAFDDVVAYQESHYAKLSEPMELACWPDDIKAFTREYSTWHYKDACYAPSNQSLCPATEAGAIDVAIAKAMAQLSAKGTPLADRAFWFNFLVHLVGDAHQPMHLCALFDAQFPDGDLAGNRYDVYFPADKKTNLHSYWDAMGTVDPASIVRPLAANPSSIAELEQMAASLMQSQSTTITAAQTRDTAFASWAAEAFEICKTAVYEGVAVDQPLTQPYVLRARRIMNRQVPLAGYRLSYMLQQAYNASTA